MNQLCIRKDQETAKKQTLRVKNSDCIKTMMTVPNGDVVINNTVKNQKDIAEMEEYNINRREHIAITVLFAIGLFLQILSHAIL
jgi:hypothetical protein